MRSAEVLVACGLLLAACKGKPTALAVCEKISAVGAGANCRADKPGGLGSAAKEKAVFDVPGVKDATGQVLNFDKASDYSATVKAFDAMAALAGRFRYGSESALIFVQMNSETPPEVGAKAEKVVSDL
jgi:hypothetical protein